MTNTEAYSRVCSILTSIVLKDDGEDAFIALQALGAMRDKAAPAVSALKKSLKIPSHVAYKCHALGWIGPAALSAETELLKVLRATPIDSDTAQYAMQALGRIGSRKVIPILIKAAKVAAFRESEPGFESIITGAFQNLGLNALSARPKLKLILSNKKCINGKFLRYLLDTPELWH